uniref:NADH dehydrogenase subunit 4L n=1 Tax=Lernaea cyprinacea TaxID=342429 RepID=A0A0U1XC94_9MAXI|nr:NADH dehydrogenase subunit 4L [Lernaea cyprinacea]AIQ80156.1 NADH dehydrogenase subunit 4L [Lernaea cyprinacea]
MLILGLFQYFQNLLILCLFFLYYSVKHKLLMLLILLEVMSLVVLVSLVMTPNLSVFPSFFFVLTFLVLEAVLGLSIMVYSVRLLSSECTNLLFN